MNEHCIKSLKNQFEESPSPLPEQKTPLTPWELNPNGDIIIPEDPDDVPDDEETPIISIMEVIE